METALITFLIFMGMILCLVGILIGIGWLITTISQVYKNKRDIAAILNELGFCHQDVMTSLTKIKDDE